MTEFENRPLTITKQASSPDAKNYCVKVWWGTGYLHIFKLSPHEVIIAKGKSGEHLYWQMGGVLAPCAPICFCSALPYWPWIWLCDLFLLMTSVNMMPIEDWKAFFHWDLITLAVLRPPWVKARVSLLETNLQEVNLLEPIWKSLD